MKKILLITTFILSSLFTWAQVPANDNCLTATNLGTLPTPAACPSGIGTVVNSNNQTNINATAPNPYTTLLNCQTGGNQPGPALDVWYRFVASGNQVNINITPGAVPVLQNPAITLWRGTCAGLIGVGCDNNGTAGGNNTALFQPLTPGQVYYIQVSGMNISSAGNFNISVQATNDCNNCLQIGNLTVSPLPVNGTYLPGTTVNFCYNITQYTQVSSNWLHGVTFNFGAGWNPATIVPTPPASCSGSGTWNWYNSWTSSATSTTWGPGFGFNYNFPVDANPGNNFGDNCTTPNWNFCWSIQTDPVCTGTNTSLNFTLNTSGDGESGSWSSIACTGDPNFNFSAVLACCNATAVGTNPTCNGGNNGTATVTPTGTAPFTYLWSNGQTTQVATGLIAGTYTVTVTDNSSCVSTATVTLTNPLAMTAPIISTNVTCNGGNNGSANVNPTGSVGPYTYLWSNGQTTQTATNLIAGPYTVTVTSAVGCTITNVVNITQPTPITVSTTTVSATCSLLNGSATANPSGGVGPYTYLWSNGQTTQTASGLGAGSYTVTVTGVGGCTATATATVSTTGSITASAVGTNVSCFGGNNGTATATGVGGSGPYTYLWSNGQTTQTTTGLVAGTYTVTVTSAGCTATATVTITQPTQLTAINSQTNVTCFGGNNGMATVTPSGGGGPYTYSWNSIPVQTTQIATNLVAGTYTCTITNANGCTNLQTVTITQPTQITSTINSTISTCGLPNGSATVNPSGGVGPYTYLWSNGGTTQTITGLLPGVYSVTITGVGGCTATNTVNVLSPGTPILSIASSTNVSCFGGSNGVANTSLVSGTGPFNYLWSNGQTGSNATGLVAGSYTVTVTDVNGCQSTTTVTITQPTQLTAAITTTNVNCNGGNNGSSNVTPNGGVGPYTYSWNSIPVQTTPTATNLIAGTYNVTITDVNGCTTVASANITQPTLLTLVVTNSVNPSCNGGTNGYITVNPAGGTSPYQFSLNGGPNQLSPTFTGLGAGSYTVAVIDSKGCVRTQNVILTQPTALSTNASITNVTCFGVCNGQLLVNVSGGVGPYTYLWSNGGTTNPITGLCAGSYSVTVTDANGCQIAQTGMVISQPVVLTVGPIATPPTICLGQPSNLISNPAGGTGPYTFLWINGTTTQNTSVSPTTTTSYTVQVTDANGCNVSGLVTVSVNPALIGGATVSPSTICAGSSTTLNATASGGDGGPYSFTWVPGGNGQSITVNPANTTTYVVTISDGCSPNVTSTVVVKVNPNPTVTYSTTPLSGCQPLTVTYANTTPGVSNCVWTINGIPYNNCTVTQTFPIQGNYPATLTVTDVNGCVGTSSSVVANVYPNPIASFTVSPSIINIMEPIVTFNNLSSSGNYQWNFGDGGTASNISPIHVYGEAGTFTVQLIVTTQRGCKDTTYGTVYISDIFSIYVPNAFTPNGDGKNETFTPVVTGYEYYEFWIFDRWGEMIYYSTTSGTPWDATYQGKIVQDGTYVWKIHAKEKDKAKHHNLVGHVTLIK